MIPFQLNFKNEHIIYEQIIKCTVKSTDFNYSYNPSLLQTGSVGTMQSYVTASYFAPYVTAVGLYDDSHTLLAVAKLSNPLPMSSDTDYNLIIKMDL